MSQDLSEMESPASQLLTALRYRSVRSFRNLLAGRRSQDSGQRGQDLVTPCLNLASSSFGWKIVAHWIIPYDRP